jgi:Cof subfamily protein (haloacid dehalogenase superfamily)
MTLLDAGALVDPTPRLIVFDVDGTLLTSDHQVTEATRLAIARLAPDVAFAVASARAPAELGDILRVLPAVRYAIAYQGAWVGEWHRNRFTTLQETRVPASSAQFVARQGVRLGLTLGWFEGADWWVPAIDQMVQRHVAITGLKPHLDPGTAGRESRPHKLMFMAPTADLERRILTLAARIPSDCATHLSHADYLEVTAAGVDKGRALQTLADRVGIPMAATMAFGDGDNDVPLLAQAGHGVAMGSGTRAAIGAAKWVTRGNDENGIAHALEAVFPSPINAGSSRDPSAS